MNKYLLKLFLLLLGVLVFQNILSQRPKVGLALSGGGAKGIAHVGVLKAIDSAGLKVDYVTGTSMGSIMGALYAQGYSGAQIDSIVQAINWDDMFATKPKYRSINIEEKDEYDKYALEVPMKHFKPQITTGMIDSEEIYLYFNKIFFPFSYNKDFTKFNIPFKCIATDLETGNAIVIDSGEIVKAVRASMAIPGVFESIDLHGKKVVDGGIIRNYPVSDLKDMGADITIGVNLFPGLSKSSDMNSALDVMYQITQYRDAEDLVRQKKLLNLNIEAPLSKYTAGSFGDAKAIREVGEEMGKQYYPYFKHLADSLNAIEKVEFNPNTRAVRQDTIIIDDVISVGREQTTHTMLRNQLGIENGKAYSSEDLDRAFREAYSTLYYKIITYDLLPKEKGHAVLVVNVQENLLSTAKFGLSFHSFLKGALLLNLTRRNIFFSKSRSQIKVALGDNMRVLGQHKQFFGKNLNDNVGASIYYDQISYPVFKEDKVQYVYTTYRSNATLNFTHTFGLKNSVTAGASFENFAFNPEVSSGNRYDGYVNYGYGYLNYSFNTLDRRLFPHSGTQGFIEGGVVYKNQGEYKDTSAVVTEYKKGSFGKFTAAINKYYPVSSRVTILQNVQAGYQNEERPFYFQNFLLGGTQTVINNQMSFVGYSESQMNTNSFATTMAGVQIKTISELYAIFRANVGVTNFYNTEGFTTSDYKFRSGFSGSVGYNLGFFPAEVTLMYTPEFNSWTTHFSLGFLF